MDTPGIPGNAIWNKMKAQMNGPDKKKLKLIAWIITPWLILYPLICYWVRRSNLYEFNKFHHAAFSGKIKVIDGGRTRDWFRLDSARTGYAIFPDGNSRFTTLANTGDSVFKSADSDTLLLFRATSGEKYVIVSRKP